MIVTEGEAIELARNVAKSDLGDFNIDPEKMLPEETWNMYLQSARMRLVAKDRTEKWKEPPKTIRKKINMGEVGALWRKELPKSKGKTIGTDKTAMDTLVQHLRDEVTIIAKAVRYPKGHVTSPDVEEAIRLEERAYAWKQNQKKNMESTEQTTEGLHG
jgi:hypothetical protein